ncbi:OLC1v1031822C2 [Oldenlandia corymbosa var. corymbosa]|uniref:OLC1v1031822C2 n=1 Tax=Oldenlandia corymbosa var. corymbosa TaxID=529605 RepID=A0AAV1CJF4_OLDCO|nr:OLC1v1031822C2 [Oldenlandia corymbosa var. corymbosa]
MKKMFILLVVLMNTINPAYSQTKHIFLLAGQSNMSGQGGVVKNKWDRLVPPESSPNPNILKLNAKLKWEVAKEPLHAGIDKNVTNGIGPGIPFANSLLKRIPDYGTIGLVPCAISGAKIIQWQKGTIFYDQLVNRAKAAVQNGGGNNTIEALLWYQGESDTMSQTDANLYKGRLQQFIIDLRKDLNLPDLLVIEVFLLQQFRGCACFRRKTLSGNNKASTATN